MLKIKSSLIFAALSIYKKSTFRDIFKTRNHTENIIDFLGGNSKEVKKFTINGFSYNVPGDISSIIYNSRRSTNERFRN